MTLSLFLSPAGAMWSGYTGEASDYVNLRVLRIFVVEAAKVAL
ncbi:MAG: hypothetical protein ACOYOU_21240 [Kiritimatiellia bacterium]